MKYRKFGNSDFEVSALGLGCMRLPTKRFFPLKVDPNKSIKLIRRAVDKGINYLDTAWIYHFGESERVLGMALQDGYRDKVHLVTKLPMFVVKEANDFDKYLDNQLKKLQTDYLDTYLFHSLNVANFEKVKKYNLLEKMEKAKQAGKIKNIGFSFHDTFVVFKEIIDYYDWDVTQIQYNYMDTAVQATERGLKYAYEKGIAVVIMEPVKGGKLANPPQEAKNLMNNAKNKRNPVDWALQYLWNLPEVSVVLSGMGNMKMLDENIASANKSGINSLDNEDLTIINELTRIYKENILVQCTACQYCMPCPFGVNIPNNFAILNNLVLEKGRVMNFLLRRGYKNMAGKEVNLNKEKTNGSAALCTKCGACLKKCPQKIDIPKELTNVHLILKERKKIKKIYKKDGLE